MIDLADWAWLVVIVVWLALRVLTRLFRRTTAAENPKKPDAEPVQRRQLREEQDEKLDDVYSKSPGPIEPR